MTTTRPPFPRWTLVWNASDWPATSSDNLAAFAVDPFTGAGTGVDIQGIRETNASMSAWRECAMAWTRGAGYTFAELHTAREIATGTTAEACAAVALLEDGRAIALPEAALQGEPPWKQTWGEPFARIGHRPGRHSNSLSGTPETDEAPQGAP